MKYLSFIRSSEKYRESQPPAGLAEAMGKLIDKCTSEGALVDTGGVAPSKDGFRMRLANGKLTTTDGPFTESKEVIGGWAILKADSRAEILRLTTEFMDLHREHWPEFECECEVRPSEFQAQE
ncbi:MAG TPA: YciI family protein [Dehalococcoidia bacterium]|nr:YciI family protein [Dehalococcoidia bacterium]